jgi:hypothetical protein
MPAALLEFDSSSLSLGLQRDVGPMTVIPVLTAEGQIPVLQALPKTRIGDINTPWEPSVFRGTGEEPRKTITFAIPDDVRSKFEAIEERVKKLLSLPDDAWTSSVKSGDKYAASMKAKIRLTGSRACRFVDGSGKQVPHPTSWRKLPVIPILELRGVYKQQKRQAGLIWEVVALMVGEEQELEFPEFL